MALPSFAQKFASKKQAGGGNSIQEEIILESSKQAAEDLAAQVSQDTCSISNIEIILTRGSKSLAPDIKGADESLLEQEIEENSLERLLKSIELAASPEELSALMQQYEELVASWSDRASKLRNEKHLKEYQAITAALTMLQKMMQSQDLLLSGKKLVEILQASLKSQAQAIDSRAKVMQAQNQKLHEQTGQLTKQLSGAEQSLQGSIEALKKDPGKLTPQELQNHLKQLQEALKQVQELKEKAASGKPLDFKEVLENLQKIQQQQQSLTQSGKSGDTALQAIIQLQQTLQQSNLMQQLQENISRLQTTQIEQTGQLTRQLSGAEQSLQGSIEALKKDPGKLTPQELQNHLKQLQEALKQVQELKEKAASGKPLDFKEVLENLQKIQQQQQSLTQSGKSGDTTLQAIIQLQQTLQQSNLMQQLQENISRLQTTQIEQTGQLTKQLSGAEQSLQGSIEALKKDPGKLTPQELQNNLKQLQEALKQVQELKEKAASGKPLDFKEVLENLQKIQQQQQSLTQSGKSGDTTLQAIIQLQQPLQQTLQQANFVQQLQENISPIIQAQIASLAKDQLPASILPPEATAQIPPEQKLPLNQIQTEYKKDLNILALNVGERVSTNISKEIKVERSSAIKDNNVIDITARLKERSIEVKNSTYKPLSTGALSNGHVFTGSYNNGLSYATNQDIQPKVMGNDTVSKANVSVCNCPSCRDGKSHGHSQENPQILQPTSLGKDVVSKAHANGNGFGRSSYVGGDDYNKNQPNIQDKVPKEKYEPKPEKKPEPEHEHGPICTCCGHGAKDKEIGGSKQIAR